MKQKPVRRPLRVGIWGHYHGGNLGDEVTVASLIHNIRIHTPGVEIFGVSLDPEDTSRRHGIPAASMMGGAVYHNGSQLRRVVEDAPVLTYLLGALERARPNLGETVTRRVRALAGMTQAWQWLQKADMLIVAGSGPLYDGWKGAWMHPFNLFKWAVLAWSTRTKFVPLTVGAGSIRAPLSHFFVRNALRLASYRSYRDPSSADLVESIGVLAPSPIFPDLGFSLPSEHIAQRRDGGMSSERTGVVGVSTLAHQDPRYLPRGDRRRYRAYLGKLVAFSMWLLRHGYRLMLLRSQVDADERVATDLQNRLKARGVNVDERIIVEPTRTYQDLLDQMAQCELVIGGRFHCHVLPFLLDKPVLGVAYHAKTFDLMEYMGQSEYCLDIDTMPVTLMIERFKQLRERREAVTETIARRVEACRQALDLQYEFLFGEGELDVTRSYLPASDEAAPESAASLSLP